MLVWRLFDVLDLGRRLDRQTSDLSCYYRASLMVEVWVTLLFYGGGVLDDLVLFEPRSIRRLFGWVALPDPTTFGCGLRRAAALLLPLLGPLQREVVAWRWKQTGVPTSLTVVLDSTVSVRYGEKQLGAERSYNPKKRGRPSHHPLLAFAPCVCS